MNVLILNCGSSSIKYQLFEIEKKEILAKGLIEKIGMRGSFLTNERNDGDQVKLEGEIIDHQAGIEYMLGVITSEKHGCITDIHQIDAVGHRVVHGGESFSESTLITAEVVERIEACIDLAPLHNPPNLKGIYAMQDLLPNVPQVAVFDTAFHQSIPDYSFMYAIPYSLYRKYGLRRYGFHGTSHRFVSRQACKKLGVDYGSQRIISAHLGNGASIAAIKNGKSVDTSMGLTPVEGLMMGTRTGDLDLGVLLYIMSREEIGLNATNTLINKHSGVLGVSGVSSDMREVEQAADDGNKRAELSLKMYSYRIKKYIGAYTAIMEGVDILIFTGGIGENADVMRAEICRGLEYLGIELDEEKNKGARKQELIISTKNSKVKIIIVPTNEELVIAEDTMNIIKNL